MRPLPTHPAKSRKAKSFWSRKFFSDQPAPARRPLGFETLEDRITPDVRTFGGLVFDAVNTFSGQSVTGVVNVRLPGGSADAMQLTGGVTLNPDNVTFTTTGSVSAKSASTFVPILNTATHTFNTTNLNAVATPSASGVTVTSADTDGVTVPILASAFTPTNIKITGSVANPIVQMEGSAGFSGFDLLKVPVDSGAAAQLGSVGAVYNKDFSVSLKDKEFSFKKIQVNTQDIKVGFEQASQSFYFDGTAKISNVVSSKDKNGKTNKKTFELASAQFGEGTKHGIVIGSSGLASAHIVVNADLDLKGLQLTADDLTVSYNAATSKIEFMGGITVSLNKAISFGAALTLPVAIDTNTGDVSLPQGLGIKGSLTVGTFGATADIKYIPDASGGYTLDAGVEIDLRGFSVGGTFTIVDGTLTSIGLSYAAGASAGIPIGNTGLNLTAFAGKVINLDTPSKIVVTGSISVKFGKELTIGTTKYSIFDASGTFTITPDNLNLTGQLNLVGGILGKGSGSVDINWTRGEYKVHVDAEMLQIFHFVGDLAFDNAGNITLNAQASVQFPSSLPLIGGVTIATANVYMQIRPLEAFENSYVAAWTTLNFGLLGSPTVGFQCDFNGDFNFLTAPPAGASGGDAPPVVDTNYPHYVTGEYAVTSEPGIDSYFVTVYSPRFAQPGYNGSREYLEINGFFDLGDGQATFIGNPQNTLNPSTPGNAFNTAVRNYAILPNTFVPRESGQVSYPGATPSERVFVIPQSALVTAANGNVANGNFGFLLASKDKFTTPSDTTFSVTKRYRAGTALATAASLDAASGVSTITVTGTAFGPNASKTSINIFRTNPTNPFGGVQIASVTLDPNNPAHHYDKTSGSFYLTKAWSGLPDVVVDDGKGTANYAFYAQINDGSNPVVRDPLALSNSVISRLTAATTAAATTLNVENTSIGVGAYIRIDNEIMLIVGRTSFTTVTVARGRAGTAAASHSSNANIVLVPNITNSLTPPNPVASIAINSPTGLAPTGTSITSPMIAFVKATVDAAAPGGYSAVFAAGGPNLAISGSGLNLSTKVIVSVDRGGFIGTGTTAAVVNGAQSMITSQTFASPAAASSFLNGIRFVANSQFTGKSNVIVNVETTTALGQKYTKSLTVPILRNPFFLDRYDGYFFDTHGFYARVGVPFFDSTGGYQLKFAAGLAGDQTSGNTYRFELVNGDLHGLTLSSTGKISGTPTTATGPAGTWTEDFFSVAVYDKFGNSDFMTYPLLIAPDEGSFFPQPIDDTATVSQLDSGVHIHVLANDIVPTTYQVNSLHPQAMTQPLFGTASDSFDPGSGKPSIYYTIDRAKIAAANITGTFTDTFQYQILEDYVTPNRIATVTVTVTPFMVSTVNNLQDGKLGSGELSLLEAIQIANDKTQFSGRQVITFDPTVFSTPQTITLDTTALVINDDLTIIGPGAGLLTINGNAGISSQGVFINYANTTISGLTITNGRRDNGGGVLNVRAPASSVDPQLTLERCVITGNQTTNGNGGGIETQYGTLTLIDCTVSANTAAQAGGGISNYKGTANLINSTIANNGADAGGGLFNLFGTMSITNVTVSSNLALDHGGGIANPGSMFISNSTITNNGADADNNSTAIEDVGGGLYTSDLPQFYTLIHNTIIAGNFVNAGAAGVSQANIAADDINGAILIDPASSFNLIGNPATASGLINGTNSNIVGTGGKAWNIDAILDRNLRDNTGATFTHALVASSPAVNKGSNAKTTALTDQRGSIRIAGGTVDIGAFEIDSESLFVTNIDDGDADDSVFPNQMLTYTITFNQDVNAATVTAADFSNAGTSKITIGAIAEPTPGVFTVQVTPTSTGTVLLQIPAGAVITSTSGKNLTAPVRDFDSVNVVPVVSGPIVVDSVSDIDDGVFTANNLSLREAIRLANETFGPNTISFSPTVFATTKTITVSSRLIVTDSVTITGPGAAKLTLSGNNTTGILLIQAPDPASIAITGLTFANGNESPGSGGAIVLIDETLSLTDCVLTGNTAQLDGGAIYGYNGSNLILRNCTFTGNSATRIGGAVSLYATGNLDIENCTFSGNQATDAGGAISAFNYIGNASLITIRNSTITGNTAGFGGGGVYSTSTAPITVVSSIISGNTSGGSSEIYAGVTANVTFSAIGASNGFTFIGGGNLPFGSDLKLGTLASNGGPVPTITLLAGSPAINAGTTSTATTDARGFPTNGIADIGAYEVQPLNVTPATLNSLSLGVNTEQLLTVNAPTLPAGTTFTFTLATGALPTGLTLATNGKLAGIPDTLGAFNFTLNVTASTGDTAQQSFTANVVNNTLLTISTGVNLTSSGAAVSQSITVGDAETPVGNLVLSASSSNPTLIPVANITFSGSSAQRTVTVLPAPGNVGTATITLIVTDGNGTTATTSFTMTVKNLYENEFSIGRDRSAQASVTIRNPNGSVRYTLTPFGANFTGGIRTAAGDFNGDGVADLVCASGPGMPGQVVVFDGVSQQPIPTPLPNNQPFGNTFTRGIIVAAGDLNADGKSDLIITAEAGGGARVRIFQSTGSGFTQRSDFIALIGGDNVPDSVKFRGGSRASVSDINGDGTGDLIWAAGAGGGPRIATFNGKQLDNGNNVFFKLTGDFFALGTNLRDGAYIAGGDVNGDGIGDLIAGGGSGAPPQVVGYSGANLIQNKFTRFLDFNFGTNSGQGIRVAVKDLNNDNVGDVIVGSAPGAGSRVAAFNGKNMAGSTTGTAIFDFNAFPGFSGGVFVG